MLMQWSVAIVAVVFGVAVLFVTLSRASRRAARVDAERKHEEADEGWVIREVEVKDAPVTISSRYAVDHDDIDRLLEEFRASKTGDRPAVLAMYRAFKTRLERHIGWEDDILFPLFERLTGLTDNGPTVVMRTEHRQIRALLDSIDAALQENETSVDADESTLLEVLAAHNVKEEHILYPMIDKQISVADRKAVFARMRAETGERG
ncbi:MAG TPA: hemerythrin domain-containing protein [Vicinamibacterales bacterium]|jgi:iron-sulfur cluster repair protein YtfE (RIC family)|nr:hemerythrin domain-containing protein [Vicinamibacterales bacterium]